MYGSTSLAACMTAAGMIIAGTAAMRRAHAEEQTWLRAIERADHPEAEAAAGRVVGWVALAALGWGLPVGWLVAVAVMS